MSTVKLTTWNVEHFGRLLAEPAPQDSRRLRAITEEIQAINPDILCISEGPGNLPDLRRYAAAAWGLDGAYTIPTIDGTDALLDANPADPRRALQSLYAMQGTATTGNQWIWFLVRTELAARSNPPAYLLNPIIWRDLTRQPHWRVYHWGETLARNHQHWRHPQVLVMTLDGIELEFLGVHLKSKINQRNPFAGDANTLDPDYILEALKARAKLATEAYDVRRYIERRFEQTPNPRIFVCGDMNDGPGREYFEREFYLFDLVSNIQGDVFFAKRFLNHALFDFDDKLRWTTNFNDRVEAWSRTLPGAEALPQEAVDRTRFQLLDHILFTQPLVGEGARPRVRANAGLVEHTIQQRINAGLPKSQRTSDHVPVSVHLTL